MPRINKIRLKNIGHSRAFMHDITLDFRGGVNTVVYGGNGVGKSSIIAFILTLLRPESWNFLPGESGEPRKIIDYLSVEYPAHIMIEWLYIGKKRTFEFLVTGLLLTKDSQDNFRRAFYSFRYPYERERSKNYLTFENIRFEAESSYLLVDEFLDQLKHQKKSNSSQKVQIIRDNITKWQNHLDMNLIDTKLAEYQVKMNGTEGAQATFLDFSTDIGFIQFIVKMLQKLPGDESLKEIKDAYQNFQKIPFLKEQEVFVKKIIEKLKQGISLEKQYKVLYTELQDILGKWLEYNIICEEWQLENKKQLDSYQEILDSLIPQRDKIKGQLAELEVKIPFLSHRGLEFQITAEKKLIEEIRKQKESISRHKNLLEILPTYRNYLSTVNALNLLKEQLMEQIKPFEEKLAESRIIIRFLIEKKVEDRSKRLKIKQDDYNRRWIEFNGAMEKKGKLDEKILTLERNIRANSVELEEISKEEKRISELLLENETVSEAIERLESIKSRLKVERMSNEEELRNNRKRITHLSSIIKKSYESIQLLSKELDKVEKELASRKKQWRKLVGNPVFSMIVEAGWDELEVDYNLLNETNRQKLLIESEKKKDLWISSQLIKQDLQTTIEQFNDTGSFPYDPDVLNLCNFLKNNQINAWIGWEYLKNSLNEKNDMENAVIEIGYLFDGIIIAEPTLDRVEAILNNQEKKISVEALTRTIPISSANVLREKPSIGKNVMILNPGLKWRYDSEYAQNHLETLEKQFKKVITASDAKHEDYQSVDQVCQIWDDFLEAFPAETSKKLESKLKELLDRLEEEKEELYIYEEQESVIIESQESISDEIARISAEMDDIVPSLQQLSKLSTRLERKRKIKKTIKDDSKSINSHSVRLKDLTDRRIPEIDLSVKKLNKEISEIRSNVRDLKKVLQDYTQEENVYEEKEIRRKSSTHSLEEWKRQYNRLKNQYDSVLQENDLKYDTIRHENEIKDIRTRLSNLYTSTGIQEEDIKVFHYDNIQLDDLTDILKEKRVIEDQLLQLGIDVNDKQNKVNELQKESTENRTRCLAIYDDLVNNYRSILQDEMKINSAHKILLSKKEKKDRELMNIETEITDSQEGKKATLAEKESLESLAEAIENWISRFSTEERKKMTSKNKLKLNFETLDKLKASIQDNKDNTRSYEEKKTVFESKSTGFIKEFRSISDTTKKERIKDLLLLEFINKFDTGSIERISALKQEFDERLVAIGDQIKAPESRLKTIIDVFTTTINDILFKLKELQSIKLNVKDLPNLHKQPIVKIKIRDSKDISAISKTVDGYFNDIFFKFDTFPSDLTTEKIVMSILENYLSGRLRPIDYLFPDESLQPVYTTIQDIKKTSGGEKGTLGILFYCLVAHFRLKHFLQSKRKFNIQSPLFMDNPFSKATRLDLIMLQVGLANKLGIQLIPFTHNKDVEVFHHYENFIALKKHKTTDKQIVDCSKELESKFKLESSSVTIRSQLKVEPEQLSGYFRDEHESGS